MMQIGFIGIGKMGVGLVSRCKEAGITTHAWNRSPHAEADCTSIEELIGKLTPGERVVWLMLPQGQVVDEMITKILPLLSNGDVLIDGGNSYYKDSVRRAKVVELAGVSYMDVGVSGGPGGAKNGACLMIGGDKGAYEKLIELWSALAAKDAYKYLGKSGAGHYAKMVHNGIEYGMMQAIAEGVAVLKASDYDFDLVEVMDIYNHQSVIESRLVGWTQKALELDPDLSQISSKISHTGEGEWTVNSAKEVGVEVPIIKESLEVRKRSSEETNSFRDKAVSAMRGQFGGHSVQKTVEGSSQGVRSLDSTGPQDPRG